MSYSVIWLDFGFSTAFCSGGFCLTPTVRVSHFPCHLVLWVVCIVSPGRGWNQLTAINHSNSFWTISHRPYLLLGQKPHPCRWAPRHLLTRMLATSLGFLKKLVRRQGLPWWLRECRIHLQCERRGIDP